MYIEYISLYIIFYILIKLRNPELIKRLFDKKVATEQACYAIWLCVDAQWRQVLLDDYLPCTKDTKNLLFSHTP
jgi:calpain-15